MYLKDQFSVSLENYLSYFSALCKITSSLNLADSGRVKVFVRIRPLNKEEVLNKTRNVLKVSEDKCQVLRLSFVTEFN